MRHTSIALLALPIVLFSLRVSAEPLCKTPLRGNYVVAVHGLAVQVDPQSNSPPVPIGYIAYAGLINFSPGRPFPPTSRRELNPPVPDQEVGRVTRTLTVSVNGHSADPNSTDLVDHIVPNTVGGDGTYTANYVTCTGKLSFKIPFPPGTEDFDIYFTSMGDHIAFIVTNFAGVALSGTMEKQ